MAPWTYQVDTGASNAGSWKKPLTVQHLWQKLLMRYVLAIGAVGKSSACHGLAVDAGSICMEWVIG